MAIPVDEWTPWVGPKLTIAWEAVQEDFSSVHAKSRQVLVAKMMKESGLAKITCIQILQKAVRAGYLKIAEQYNPYTKTGPTLLLDITCDDRVFLRWNAKPVRKFNRKERIRKAIDAKEARHNPLERKFDN